MNCDIDLCDFDKISSILFEEGMTWKSCDALFGAVYCVGNLHGFEPIKENRQFAERQGRTAREARNDV